MNETRFSPVVFLDEEMSARGWTRETLAHESMLGPTIIDAVMSGKRPINLVVAHGLSLAFGTSRDYWVNLQALYDAPVGEQ